MSLLMDALRKAEEEKRRAALERQGQSGAPPADAGAPSPDHLASTFPPEGAETPPPASQTGEHTSNDLRLEPLEAPPRTEEAGSGTGSVTGPGEAVEPFGDTTRMRLTAAQRDVFDALGVPRRNEATGSFESPTGADLDSTVPSKRMLKRSLEEYFEPTRSMEATKPMAGAAAEAKPELGVDSGPITAQTVFSAKRRGKSSSMFNAAAALLLLGAAGLGAVGAYHWYTQSRVPRVLPSPTVAQDVEREEVKPLDLPAINPMAGGPTLESTASPAAPVEPSVSAVPPTPAGAPAETDTSTTTEVPSATPHGPATSTPEGVRNAPPTWAAPPVESRVVPVATASTAVPAETPAVSTAPTVAAAEPKAVAPAVSPAAEHEPALPAPPGEETTTAMVQPPTPADIERLQAATAAAPRIAKADLPAPRISSSLEGNVLPGEIRITRSRPTQPLVPGQVQEAYDAYQRGDFNRAETLYRVALARYPQNRDALLGIAALNWRRGDRAAAAETYARLLQIDPNDSVARSALLTLRKSPNAIVDESTVKLMLRREPESPQLRFVLGNVYARQARWSEAQQAYFDALARDKTNPDFAFNLAVSLDNLGEQAAAASYYRKALDLSARRPARFAAKDANSRLQALTEASGSSP